MTQATELKRILTPAMVWGLGVGYVISGNYFGWNLGLAQGGTLGMAIATAVVIMMYVTFTYSYAELACAIPKAGGAFDYASRTLGRDAGFIVGMAQNIEFIFAPPAIAFGAGSYLNLFFPEVAPLYFSIGAYVVFTALNIYGIKAAATVELFVTVVAVAGLLLFAVSVMPMVELKNLSINSFPSGAAGIFAATPFAIWFFLGIEGVANLAEEAVDPRKAMSRGFLSALFTLITVCVLTFICAIGVSGWEAIVNLPDGTTSDSPLPLAIRQTGAGSWPYNVVVIVGLFGLIASLNGLMLAAGRSTYEFSRAIIGSKYMGVIHSRYQTPTNALLLNMFIGILALCTGRTGEVITISVFGALTLYCVSMISMMSLRKKEPGLERPFRVPLYPVFPIIALVIAMLALTAVVFYNLTLCLLYLAIIGIAFGIFKLGKTGNR